MTKLNEQSLRMTLDLSGAISQKLYSVGPAREYKAQFVRAGRIRRVDNTPSNIEITAQALESAAMAGLFDKKAIFVDHAGWFDYPSLDNLVGVTKGSSWNSEDETVEGVLRLFDTPSSRVATQIIDELLIDPEGSPDVGLSMVFFPRWAPRDNEDDPRRIIEIRHIESVDLVFQPAAEGRVIQALSANAALSTFHANQPSNHQPFTHQLSAERCTLSPSYQLTKGESEMPEETITTQSVETPAAEACPEPREGTSLPPLPSDQAPESPSQGEGRGGGLNEWIHALSTATTQAMISASGLPLAARERLANRHFSNPDEIRAAIKAERSYLARLNEDQVVQIGGTPPRDGHISMGRTPLEKIETAVEALFSGTRPPEGVQPLSGIRELYHLLSGDYEMNGLFQPERIQFANVTSSTMANLVANVLNKRVMNEFQQYPRWWEPIVIIENFSTLQDVKWISLGGVGELPTVAEGAAYTELTWDDFGETDSFVKKGGYLGITLEAIDKDDTGRVRAAPRALAQGAWLTLAKSVSAIFTASSGVGPTMSDSLALFHTTHGNLGTTALSITEYTAVRTAMRKQTEINSSERLGALTAPKFLLVPPDLEITALQVLASEYDYTYALSNGVVAPTNVHGEGDGLQERMNFARSRVIVVDLWTDTNNWAAVCDPRLYPTIGLGFRYGNTPEIFSVASPTAGLMFTNDTMPVKVRFIYAVGPIDYRGMYKENVA